MNTSEPLNEALELLDRAETAYVTSIDARGRPQTRAMFNLRNKAMFPALGSFFVEHGAAFTVYFTTNTSSSKVADLRANPALSVYYCAPKEFVGLMLGGDAEIVDDSRIRHAIWQPGWTLYYPGGPDDPDHTVLRLSPTEGKLYRQLRTTRII